jgi:uncharacterized membrane protein (UPF0182 family)
MMARNDPDHYGELLVFSVSDATAPSPQKAASAIDSDQFISSQFSLLDQRGSKVEKGEVQLVPVGPAVLFLRPIWITGSSGQEYPRYRFIAAVSGDRAVLGKDVNDAVKALVNNTPTDLQRQVQGGTPIDTITPGGNGNPGGNTGGSSTTTTTTPGVTTPGTQPPQNASSAQLLAAAQREFDLADQALAAKDLGSYQAHVAQGEALLRRALSQTGTTSTSTTTRP